MQLNIKITQTVNINNITYLVNNENVLSKMDTADKCVTNIIKDHYDECSKIKMNKTKINEIDIGNLIVININDNLYDSCSNFTYPLQGHYLIKFNNCEISINDYKIVRYESRLQTIIPNFNTLPSNISDKLPIINFTNVKEIEKYIKEKKIHHNFYTIYILLFIFFVLYLISKIRKCISIRRDSNLNGGEVICEDHITSPTHSPMSLTS